VTEILLVEDNDLNRDMLTRRLERRGYQVVTAGCDAYDTKPIELPRLVLKLQSLLPGAPGDG